MCAINYLLSEKSRFQWAESIGVAARKKFNGSITIVFQL